MSKIKCLLILTSLFIAIDSFAVSSQDWAKAADPLIESRPEKLQLSKTSIPKREGTLCANPKKGEHTVCSIFGKDDRVEIDYQYLGEKWVVCINPDGPRCSCSGALIGDEYVLTAAHCVTTKDKKTDVVTVDEPPMISIGHTETKDDEIIQVSKMWISEKYIKDNHWEKDWAILKLEKKAKVSGHFILSNVRYTNWFNKGAKESESKNAGVPFPIKVNHAGFGYNFRDGKVGGVHYGCSFKNVGAYAEILLHDCDMGKGNSGGPMWVKVTRTNNSTGKPVKESFAVVVGVNYAERYPIDSKERSEIYEAMPENKKDPYYLKGKEHSVIFPDYSDRFGNLAFDTVYIEKVWDEVRSGTLAPTKELAKGSTFEKKQPFIEIPSPKDLGIDLGEPSAPKKPLRPPRVEIESVSSFLPNLKTVSMVYMNKELGSRVGYNVHPPEDKNSDAYRDYIQNTLLTERGHLFQLALDNKGKLWSTKKSSDKKIPFIYEKMNFVADWSYTQLIAAPFGPATEQNGEPYNFYMLHSDGYLCFYEFKATKDEKNLEWLSIYRLHSKGPKDVELRFTNLEVEREKMLFIGTATDGKKYSWKKDRWVVFNP